jgi:hypothetical protein
MKMNSITMPKVLDYYVSLPYRQLLNNKFIESDCEQTDDKLYIITDYDQDLFTCLRFYLEKIKKTTIGNNMYVYEYELGIKSFKGDQDFVIFLDDGTHVCSLDGSYVDDNKLILIFKLKK